ncbi:MAG: alginate export family protein [Acidobacteriia bacterium]|nr:alginate export family protein [Terriglobia bacterium]
MKRWLLIAGLLSLVPLGSPGPAAAETATGTDEVTWHWFGSLRMRPEYNDNLTDFSAARDDKIGYASYRVNLGTDIGLDKGVSVTLNAQALGKWGEDQTPIRGTSTVSSFANQVGFFEAYVDAKHIYDQPFSLRVGRQRLVFGDQWLLGDLDFYGGTSWDGIRGDLEFHRATVTPFWASVAKLEQPEILRNLTDAEGNPIDASGGDFDLYGLWSTWKLPGTNGLDAAILYSFDHRSVGGFPFQDKRWTYTVRYSWGAKTGPFFNGDLAAQTGNTVNTERTDFATIHANAMELTGGWVWIRAGDPYRIQLRYARYSGDDAGTSGTNETFVPLAMNFHERYGLVDAWTGFWRNQAYIGGVPGYEVLQVLFDVKIPSGVRLKVFGQTQRRTTDIAAAGSLRSLGQEFGVSASGDYGKHVTLDVGFAQIYPGTAAAAEPPLFAQDTARRLYVNTIVRF